MKVFVIHYKKLVERKKFILEQFNKNNITDYEFVEIDRDELQNQDLSIFKPKYSNWQIAILLSHFYAYKEIAEKYENALILEDDVILCNNFMKNLTKYMEELPNDYDMLFLGNGCKFHIPSNQLIKGKYIYKKCNEPTEWGGNGATRCTDSYVVNKKCALNICQYIKPLKYEISSAIDWWLNDTIRKNNFIIYWAEPTIVTQGTQNNLFKTSY
jgi:GR25 family glycosyltransferase involved in LPS biosynthesis